MGLIYIRHGEDYVNSHEHDERLTHNGKQLSTFFATKLIKDGNDIPDVIYHSPYYRARQTAKLFVKAIKKKYGIKVERKLDPKLGRYFTRRQKENPDIKRSTHKKGAIIYESWDEFKDRIREQLIEKEEESLDKNIWCVTHSLVIIKVCSIKNIKRKSKWVKYLEKIIIS